MDAQLKAKWVEALRSGEYKQARGTLRDENDAYCCLGVLCKIAGIAIIGDGTEEENDYAPIYNLVGGRRNSHQCSMRNDGNMPEGVFIPGSEQSFAQIADYIEENL